MKCFVICYNRLTWLKQLCAQLQLMGLEVILIDNNSTYLPLLQWYENGCPYTVIRMDKNMGHQVLWKSGLIDQYEDRYYMVTDHDLNLAGIPNDMVDVLMLGLLSNEGVIKSGLSLRIDDLPANDYSREAIEWEKKFWETPQDANNFYRSDIDTTLAIYDRERDFGKLPNNRFFSAVRSPEPYTARHMPWYVDREFLNNNPEEVYYLERTNTYWAEKLKKSMAL